MMLDEKNSEKAMAVLRSVKLFSGVDEKLLLAALGSGDFEYCEYSVGDTILSPDTKAKKAVIFLSGKAEVYSADEGRSLLLRTFEKGHAVGVSNLFSSEDFVSRVIASKKCETLEISPEKYGKILERDRNAMYNYVSFLSAKIRYLNKKIVCLTAGSAERRLAYFLDSSIPDDEAGVREITVQMNALCDMLNLGRASLYRAAEKLCEEGFIARDGKTIKVIGRKGMMEKYK
jgi:CRP-like cAMP-binding protein